MAGVPDKNGRQDLADMPQIRHGRAASALAVAFVLTTVLFLGAPGLDLWASSLFFDPPGGGFWLQEDPAAKAVRSLVWNLSIVALLVALVGLCGGLLLRRPIGGVPTRAWGFILALYVLAPGIIVNLILKAYWGRARPSDVVEFGGALDFTPAGVIARQCAANCSFTSGEGASAAALAVSALLVLHYLRPRLPVWVRRLWVALALLLPIAGAAQRVATGRHFLSDTVFSVLIVFAVALALHWLFGRHKAAPRG
ncbi:MAG: phosphoesterase [Alphaproteobacteria bacterium HGW-Alphaproteobacteria-10]|nr:MAG: phosphoesterase [Alphaproteobacteria bacterium HGW-Alphaproteobacteria-10]